MTDVLKNLEKQLALQDWPSVYMFKFIFLNNAQLMAKVSALFDDSAQIKYQSSKNAKYISLSAKELMMDSASIIEKYKKASLIEGVIAL